MMLLYKKKCYQSTLQPVNGMNMWKVTTNVRVTPPLYKRPPRRPPGKKRQREQGEPRPGKQAKRGIKMHCSICRQEGHNKSKCTNQPVPKPPKKPPGRPKLKFVECGSSSQSHASSSQPLLLGSFTQPEEDLPTLSAALPRPKRGRPRKNQENATAPTPMTESREPVYDTGPRQLPREGYGVFASPITGDDYIHVGRSVRDTHDQTMLPSDLYRTREAKKQAVLCGRGRGRARPSSQP